MNELNAINLKLESMKMAVNTLIQESALIGLGRNLSPTRNDATTDGATTDAATTNATTGATTLRGGLPPLSIMGVAGLPLGICLAIQKFETIQQLASRVASGMVPQQVKLFGLGSTRGKQSLTSGEYPNGDLYYDHSKIIASDVGLASSPTHLSSPSMSILTKPLIKTAEQWIATMTAVLKTIAQLNHLNDQISTTAKATTLNDDPLLLKEMILLHSNVIKSKRQLTACIEGVNGDGIDSAGEMLQPLSHIARITFATTDMIEQASHKLDQLRIRFWKSTQNRFLYVCARTIQACWRGYWYRVKEGTFLERFDICQKATLRIQYLLLRMKFDARVQD